MTHRDSTRAYARARASRIKAESVRPGHGSDRQPLSPIDWLTYEEVANLLMVTVQTIRNRMSRHKDLERVLVPVGSHRRMTARVPPATVRALARYIKTAPWLAQ